MNFKGHFQPRLSYDSNFAYVFKHCSVTGFCLKVSGCFFLCHIHIYFVIIS